MPPSTNSVEPVTYSASGPASQAIARLGLDRRWMRPALIYAMGSLAAYWSVERIGAVLAP